MSSNGSSTETLRKQRIMQHLELTGNIRFQRSSRNLKSKASTPVPTPSPIKIQSVIAKKRKERIMKHLSNSGTNFDLYELDKEKRKQQIQAHISKTRG